ncbi:MAG: hypothetical protein GQ580_02790 [Candidatus Thorarchaeota archaeon]|nr:hypothetical protein [Candidatus Thorarchaeota archaeon]
MRRVGSAAGIDLFAPADAYFSYFNSPYIGHKQGASIDIYPSHGEWGGPAYSPIAGRIIRVKKMRMGEKKLFPSDEVDFGIAIAPEGSTDIVRILHCVPEVDEGATVEAGQRLGSLLRSRYFNYWTGPHYHIEIMNIRDFNRSTKSYPLTVDLTPVQQTQQESVSELECLISRVTDDVMIATTDDSPKAVSRNIVGHAAYCGSDRRHGILDAGVPHYSHGGILGFGKSVEESTVTAWSTDIGYAAGSLDSRLSFKRGGPVQLIFEDEIIRGVSCFAFTKKQTVKGAPPIIMIPQQYGGFSEKFAEGDVGVLSFKRLNDIVKE